MSDVFLPTWFFFFFFPQSTVLFSFLPLSDTSLHSSLPCSFPLQSLAPHRAWPLILLNRFCTFFFSPFWLFNPTHGFCFPFIHFTNLTPFRFFLPQISWSALYATSSCLSTQRMTLQFHCSSFPNKYPFHLRTGSTLLSFMIGLGMSLSNLAPSLPDSL